jgi:hypothetical protein
MPWAPEPREEYPPPFLPESHRARAAIQSQLLGKRLHPLTGRPLKPIEHNKDVRTCGQCAALHGRKLFHRTAWKCELRDDASPATDVRKHWPACDLFREREA